MPGDASAGVSEHGNIPQRWELVIDRRVNALRDIPGTRFTYLLSYDVIMFNSHNSKTVIESNLFSLQEL